MNTDVVDLLHESIDRLTEGERIPGGLAERAFRRHRQRRIALGAAGVTGTALAAAAAVFVATAVTSGAPQPGNRAMSAQTTAYVLSRTERALVGVERENVMQEIRVAAHGSQFILTSQRPLEFAPHAVFWTYRGQFRDEGFTAGGKPVFNASAVYVPAGQHRSARATTVDYAARTWSRGIARTRLTPRQPRGKCAYLPAPVGEQVNWPARIREVLSCGQYRVTGRQWIGGIHTIRITSGDTARAEWPDLLGEPGDLPSGAGPVGVAPAVRPRCSPVTSGGSSPPRPASPPCR